MGTFNTSLPLALNAPPPPPNPLTSIGQLMSIRDAASQIALRNAQVQQSQQNTQDIAAQAQQRQQDINDQRTVMQAMQDPAVSSRVHTGDFSDLEGKILPKNLDAIRQAQTAYQSNLLKNTSEQNQIQSEGLGNIVTGINGLKSLRGDRGNIDLEKVNEALPELVSQLSKTGAFRNAGIDPSKLPQAITDPAQLDGFLARVGGTKAATDQVLGQQKTQAETAASTAAAAASQSTADLNEIKGQREQMILDSIKQGQAAAQSGQNPIDTVFPATLDPVIHDSYKAAYNTIGAQPPDENGRRPGQDALISAAAAHAASIQLPQNPNVIAGEAKKAAAVATATLPIEVQKSVDTQLAMAKNSPDAFAGIVDPRTRMAAESQFQKDSQDYASKVGSAQQLKDTIAAAQSGNKAAPAIVPIEELRGFVNRVNRQELQSVGGGGDLYDRVQGFVSKYTAGQPVPAAILKDMSSLADIQVQAARRTYEYNTQINNATHGGKVTPIDLAISGASAKPSLDDIFKQ